MAETILLPVEDDHAENTATEKKPSRGITILSSSIEDQGVTSFDVVAIHGIYGHRETSWTDGSTVWMVDEIHKHYTASQVLSFGYCSDDIFTSPGLTAKALHLLDELLIRHKDLPEKDALRPLIFIAHDIGGTILKKALSIASLERNKYLPILTRLRLLIFAGCPHRSTDDTNLENMLAKLLYTIDENVSLPPNGLKSVKRLAKSISSINEDFWACKVLASTSVVDIYSDNQTVQDQIFDKHACTMDMPFEIRLGYEKRHNRLCQATSHAQDEDLVKAIDLALSNQPLYSNELHTFKCLKPACAEQTMRLLGSPVFPLKNRYVSDSPFKKLICQNESFVTWQKARGPSILHVYAPLNSIEVSEYISQSCMMENPTDVVLYFNIDPHDCQRNTAMSILQSWLSQIWPNSCELIQASSTACFLQRSMCLSSSWTLLDLVTSFRTILWSFSTKFIAITCVVRGLDECDDQLDFIQLFRDFAAETEDKYKLVSVTASHDAFQNALSDCLTIDLSSQILDKTGTEAEIHQELLALTDEVPELSTFQNTVIEKLRLCGNDVSRRTLLLNEFRLLKNCTIGFDVGRELNGNQASSLDYTILRILKRIPIQRQKWARRTIALILYAVRPLSIWELPILLYLEFDNPNCPPNNFVHISFDDVVSEIQTAFGGMIIVEHNMFRFLTPEIRSFFQPTDGSAVLWYHVMEEVAHEEVFDSLCGYLLLTQTHKYLQVSREDVDGFAQMPEMAGKYDLDQYAVTYWPHHYSLIPIEKRKDNTVEYHSRIRRIIRSWSSAYWRFDNPITRRNRSFISDLPLLAHLGFLELVIQQLHESRHTSRDITLATTEAARVGNVSIVRELVLLAKSDKACQTDLDDMLHAAVSSGKEQVILVVLDYIGKNIVGSELPPDVMIRAAQLGHTKILTKLFESGATQRPYREAEQEKAEPLYVAALSGQVEAVNILLSQKPDLEAISGKMGRNALHVASVNGHGEVVKLLLAAGSDIEALDIQSQPALSLASYFSSYAVIEELASFGCRMEGCLLSDGTKLSHPLATMATHAYFKSAEALLRHGAKTEGPELGFCTPLQCAMSESNLEFCQLLLSHGANPNNAGFGDPIMGIAAGNGDFEIVKLLIEKGADVDAVSELGWTALHKAAENDRREVQTYLLDRGADVDIQSQSGHTAISLAVSNNHPEVVKQLIDRGANVHLASTNGWSPIQLAYDSGEITRLLMEAGADGRRATNDLTPLYFAASRNSTETVQALIVAGVDLEQEQVNDTHNTALTIAVKNGHVDSARALLEAGANINHRSDRQNFPLQYAVIYDLRSMVRLLLEFGASTELVDQDGDTALCIVEKTSLEVVKMLANIGANLDSRNKLNETTLCKAVDLRKVEMVKYLISRKVNVNVTGGPRGGPIHIACYLPHLEMVKMLIAAGADCNLLDPRCGTPLQILCLYWYEANTKEEREEIAHYLLEDCHADVGVVGGEQGCALNAACGFASLGIVRLMLEKGAKVDVQDSTGRVAIHFAAMQAFSYIQAVMTAGASIEAVDKTGRTVLHWAVSSASLEVVERVFGLASHALNQPDIDGWTPLLWACRGGGTYMKAVTPDVQLSIIKFLLDQGADPSIRAQGLDREWSALQIARYHGMDDETIQLLTTRTKKKLKEASKPWVEAEYAQRAATQPRTGWCDSCYGVRPGFTYHCSTCPNFDLCYKCYKSKDLIHGVDHVFEVRGVELEAVVEVDSASPESSEDEGDGEDSD